MYLSIAFAWFITDFTENAVCILILDIARASVYLFYSLLDCFYHGTGLKELYVQNR